MRCKECNKEVKRLISHLKTHHPEVYKEECEKAIELYKGGMTLRDIGAFDGSIFSFGSPLIKLIQQAFSKGELEQKRVERMKKSVKQGYSKGKYKLEGRGRKKKAVEKLKTRKKIWDSKIPIDFPKTKNISTKLDCYTNELIVWKGNELTDKYLCTKTEDERDEIAKDLLNFFLEYDWNRVAFKDEELKKDWKALLKYKPRITQENGETFIYNTGTSGSKLVRHFFPNLLKIGADGRNSIYDVLNDKDLLFHTIRNRIGNTLLWNPNKGTPRQFPMRISPTQIINGAKNSGLASMGSNFKGCVAKAIYSKWCKSEDRVLDYSCGFGGRLFGCMAAGKNLKYYGYDPNTETYNNLLKAIKYFDFNAEIKCCGSEEDRLFDEKFDFCFSSPPYHTHEIYCDEKTQSYNRFPKYEDWLEGYWRKTVQNIKIMLKDDAVFAINIGGLGNAKMRKIATDVCEIIEEEGFKQTDVLWMKTSMSHLSGKKNKKENEKKEGIYFYKAI